MSEYGSRSSIKCNRIVCPLSAKTSKRARGCPDKDKCDQFMDLKSGEQVYAVKQFYDRNNIHSLTFASGEIITLLDQYPDGLCKGFITKNGPTSKVGFFPATNVVPCSLPNPAILKVRSYVKDDSMVAVMGSPSAGHRRLSGGGDSRAVSSSHQSTPVKKGGHVRYPVTGTAPTTTASSVSSNSSSSGGSSSSGPDNEGATSNTLVARPVIGRQQFHHLQYSCDCGAQNSRGLDLSSLLESGPHVGCLGEGGPNQQSVGDRSSSISMDSGWGSANTAITTNIQSIPEHMTLQSPPHTPGSSSPSLATAAPQISQSLESGLFCVHHHSGSPEQGSAGSSSSTPSLGSAITTGGTTGGRSPSPQKGHTDYRTREEQVRIKTWLEGLKLGCYADNFISAGYDFTTVLKMTPEDLNAIGVTNPTHRKQLKTGINQASTAQVCGLWSWLPDSVEEWLRMLDLGPYIESVLQQGYTTLGRISELTWEDLEEVGVRKLGHQKKLILAVEQLRKSPLCPPSDKPPVSASPPAHLQSVVSLSHSSEHISSSSSQPNTRLPPRPSLDPPGPPPTPRRTSSIPPGVPTSMLASSGTRHHSRDAYVNMDAVSMVPVPPKPREEVSLIPFANEDCGTIKQRSSSLGRHEAVLRLDEVESGTGHLRALFLPLIKPVLPPAPLSLPYSVTDRLKSVSTAGSTSVTITTSTSAAVSDRIKLKLSYEKDLQNIPTDLHVAACEKVPLPKLQLEDNSSNEDFNEICDMLEDLTDLLDKEVTRSNTSP